MKKTVKPLREAARNHTLLLDVSRWKQAENIQGIREQHNMNNVLNNKDDYIEYQQQYETIDSPERIFSLIKSAVGPDHSLKIVADHGDELFLTSLLNIDYENKTLYLKKIQYTFGHLMVIDSKSLTVYSQHDGAEVSFRTHLSRYSERDGGYYEAPFPEQVKYCQRRTSYRVHVSYTLGIKAVFYTQAGLKVEAFLRDISTSGLRLQLARVDPEEFKEQGLIQNCIISLPDQEKIHCNLKIRHKQNHVRNNGCTIGGSFFQMNSEQKRDIQKFIAGLERRLLREVRI